MFREKSDAELANMSEVELAQYFKDYQIHKEEVLKNAINKNLKDEIEKLKSEISAISDKRADAITKVLEAQGSAIEKMSKSIPAMSASKNAKLSDLIAEKSEALKVLKENGNGKVVLETKAMTIGANMVDYTQGQVEMSVTRLAERRPFLANILNSATLSSADRVIWFEQQNRVGDANHTGEGLLKSASSFEVIEKNELAKKVTQTIKVSTEMLSDVTFIEGEIRNELLSRIALKVDEQLLVGTGTGSQLLGIKQNAVAFAPGAFASAVVDANYYDVLAVAINQVMLNNFMPNYILLNPSDITKMNLTKASDGHYILPAFVSPDGREVKSTPIIFNNGVEAGKFYVIDSTKATVFTRQNLTIDFGYENDDFTKNMVTIRGEWRGLNRIKANEYGAFVYGDFATAQAAILKP